ncbi:SymE family type I addiction module toxin [Pseudomonas protegens]
MFANVLIEVSSIPWLRLRGHWLQQVGFKVNQKIRIEVSKNRLVITTK